MTRTICAMAALGLITTFGCGADRDEDAKGGPGAGDDDGSDDGAGDDGEDGDGDGGDGTSGDSTDGGDDGTTGDGGDGDCYVDDPGVGLNSLIPRPGGQVARDAPFAMSWSFTETQICGGNNVTTWSTKNGPFLGDLDGDGNLDMSADLRLGGVVYFLGDGNGSFGSRVSLETCTSGGQVDFGDVDTDGDIDLLNGSHSGAGHVYLNGGGTFAEIAGGPLADGGVGGLQGAAFGDFDRDGALDVILGADQFASGAWIFKGDGAGGFSLASASGLGSPVNFGTIVTGDFDNDDDIDIFGFVDYNFDVSGGGDPNGPTLFLNGGDGTSWSMSAKLPDPFPGGLGQPAGVAVGDVNCDGNLDVVVTGTVYLGDGNGGLSSGASLASGQTFGPHTNLGDMDGDGHLDVIVSDKSTGIRLFYGDGDGSGTSFSEVAAGLPTEAPTWIDIGDLDNNGNLDVFTLAGGPSMQAWIR